MGAGGGQVAAVEVDCVRREAALERGWQGSLALAEAYCSVEACEGDVWMVGMIFGVFRGERALLDALAVPEGYRPIGAVALGWPGPDRPSPSLKRGRRASEHVIHRGRW